MPPSRHPVGLVVGTGMQGFLPRYADGEWKLYNFMPFETESKAAPAPSEVSVEVYEGEITYPDEVEVPIVAISRHGRDADVITRPHEIGYASNMLALHLKGVRSVLATSAVGVAYPEYLEQFLVPSDIYDQSGRVHALHPNRGELHSPMGEPFSKDLIACVEKAAVEVGLTKKLLQNQLLQKLNF